MRAGEKVCIHAMTPMHVSSALASRQIAPDALGGLDDWFAHDPYRNGRARVQAGRDLARVLGNLLQRLVAIEILAAGDEPDLEGVERLHGTLRASLRESLLAPTGARGSAEASTRNDCTQPLAYIRLLAAVAGSGRGAGRRTFKPVVSGELRRMRRQRRPAR